MVINANQGVLHDRVDVNPVGCDPPPRNGMKDEDITGFASFVDW